MKVSVIIPAYNEEKYIEACLKSLLSQTEMPDEIIIVDNNSTDKTTEIVKKFPQVKLLHERKQGIIPARNKGFNNATGDIIGRIDADTVLPKNWIKKLKKAFRSNPSLVAYSGPIMYEDRRFNKLLLFPEKFMLTSFKKLIGGDCLYGPNMALRKSAWQKVKKYTCTNDKIVHEDFDIAVHLAEQNLGEVMFDKRFIVRVSERRWKKIAPYLEYPYRYLRTIQHHKRSLHILKEQSQRMKKAFPKTRGIVRKIRSSIQYSMHINN